MEGNKVFGAKIRFRPFRSAKGRAARAAKACGSSGDSGSFPQAESKMAKPSRSFEEYILLMEEISLRLIVDIPLFTQVFCTIPGGWPWDF